MADKQARAPRRASRRAVLQGLAALAASGWLPAGLAQSTEALSAKSFAATALACTGYAFGDPGVASAMLRALNARVGSAKLARLAALATRTPSAQLDAALKAAGLEQTAEVVVAALYTGIVDTPTGTIVVSYDQALVWQACVWTKPNAFCGGATNYWADPPSATS